MKDILIRRDEKGGTIILTTNSPASTQGIPILKVDTEDTEGEFGPSDIIGEDLLTAAEVVVGWAKEKKRIKEKIEAARLFLSQWPGGPQIE